MRYRKACRLWVGKYRGYFPENEEEPNAVWSRLKKMIDSIFGEKV
jgi:hypothetical protein